MSTYNFKKEVKVYVVSGGNQYQIDVSDISFSQTFKETSYPVKTLHTLSNVFEGSVINSANNADFEFSMPALVEADYTIIESLLLQAESFDLFIKTEADVFKLETAVITNGSFVIERSRPLSISISGEASKLTRGATLTGTAQSRSATSSFTIPTIDITLNSSSLSNIFRVGIELQNDISWTPYKTVNGALSSTNASTSMYPSSFSLDKKILSGSITQYLLSDNTSSTQDWDTDATLSIKAGNGASGSNFRGFSFGPATCSFTNRINIGEVFLQGYDWRMTENPTSLATILKYETD